MTENCVGNRDPCGRCRVRHGGNNHYCPVHGAVSAGCCEQPCQPKDWEWIKGKGQVRRAPPPQEGTDIVIVPGKSLILTCSACRIEFQLTLEPRSAPHPGAPPAEQAVIACPFCAKRATMDV